MAGEGDKQFKVRTGTCHHPQCSKGITEVYRCRYCGGFFCREHLHPKPPGQPSIDKGKREDWDFMEEWSKSGHPCPQYIDFWKDQQQRIKKKRYKKQIDKPRDIKPGEIRQPTESYPPGSGTIPKKYKTRNTLGILILLLLITLLFIYRYNLDEIVFNPERLFREVSGIIPAYLSHVNKAEPHEETTTTLMHVPTTSTMQPGVLDVNKTQETCLDYCKSLNYSGGRCVPHPNNCRLEGMIYVREGNDFCSKTGEGFDTFCCCE